MYIGPLTTDGDKQIAYHVHGRGNSRRHSVGLIDRPNSENAYDIKHATDRVSNRQRSTYDEDLNCKRRA